MPPSKSLNPPVALDEIERAAGNLEKTNSPKAAAEVAELTRHALPAKTWRDFHRLLGFPESLSLDLEPGAAIHLYHELIAPYQKVPHGKLPPLLDMHFRDLARLQLELQAWEAIRDAELQNRAEQAELAEEKNRYEQDRQVGAIAPDVFEKGLSRQPDSPAKFREQSECLILLKHSLRQREFDGMEGVLERLYGNDLTANPERGQLISLYFRHLTDPEDAEPLDDEQFKILVTMVDDEYRDVMKAWELELLTKSRTEAAKRASFAPTRQDHWMNRQGDRLRQAIDRKMRFTVTLLKVLGLAEKNRPTRSKKRRKTRRAAIKIRRTAPDAS